jgi:flagellar basal body P-ring formation protein FlgA
MWHEACRRYAANQTGGLKMYQVMTASMLIVLLAGTARAQAFEDLTVLEAKAAAYSGMAFRPLDRRVMLARCPEPVIFESPTTIALAVRCESQRWRIQLMIVPRSEQKGVDARPVVQRGQLVELTYLGTGFELAGQGIAQNEARVGDRVRVKNPTSGTSSEGIADAQGMVLIAP